MPRRFKKTKPLVYVFYEGESEQKYIDFLKKTFSDVAVIKRPASTGLFEAAESKFKSDPQYKNYAEITDEIWFFFDVETEDIPKWEDRLSAIKRLRKLRKDPQIKVRLLMTTGCIEYWLMLHYEYCAPRLNTVAEKERMENRLKTKEPSYQKGDEDSIFKIAEKYEAALKNGTKSLSRLKQDGLPSIEETDERNQWLVKNCLTFTTVQQAIDFLKSLGG